MANSIKDVENLTEHFIKNGINALEVRIDALELADLPRFELFNKVRKEIDQVNHDVPQSLDRMLEIYEFCIEEALNLAVKDEELMQFANASSYNLAANLADCWEDDIRPRQKKHFVAGLKSAHRCLKLRRQLNKPPIAVAMGYFILGVHEYALHNYKSAENAWMNKLENEMMEYESKLHAKTDLNVILSQGLLGLARWSLGSINIDEFEQSIFRLEKQRNADNDAEVNLFIAELQLLKKKHGPAVRA